MASAQSQNPLDRILRGVITDGETDAPALFTPALNKLSDDQRDWLHHWTRDGYDSRRDLITSVNQMQFWSLGRVPDSWYKGICSKHVLLSVLITSDRRTMWREDPVDLETAKEERRMLAAKYIRPAFRAAFRELRTDAKQYTNEEERVDSVESQPYFAMRPALNELYERQSRALVQLLDGFDSMDDVDDWLSRLDGATLGELAKVEPDFDWMIHRRQSNQTVLLGDTSAYERERELWASVYLLPAYNRAVGVLGHHADEHREDEQRERMQPKQL